MTREFIIAALHRYLSERTLLRLVLSDGFAEAGGVVEVTDCLEPLVSSEKFEALQALPLEQEAADLAETFDHKEIQVLLASSEDYPSSLRSIKKPPPVLYVKGSSAIVNEAGFGICGSRKASNRGIQIAGWFGAEVAKLGAPEVSGYAKGVDTAAHLGALQAGGTTVVVLAEGILRFRMKKDFAHLTEAASRMLVVSEFHPARPWSAHGAMQRNATICGLSDAMVVVEAQATGGTVNAGFECLRQGKPLFVAQFGEDSGTPTPEGNLELIKRGGIPVNKHPELTAQLREVKERSSNMASSITRQLELPVPS